MNFIVGVALTVPFSAVYRSLSKRSVERYMTVIAAGIAGMAAMVAAGVLGNFFIAPPYFEFYLHINFTSVVLWGYIGSATILNVAKAALVGILMYPLTGVIKKRNIKL